MVIIGHPDFEDKYRTAKFCNFNYYYLFELIDIVCQFVYAIFVAKDMIEVCLAVEIFWFVILIAFRPYNGKSDHSLSAGNALVLIISNSALLYYKKHESLNISLAVSIIFVVLACLPAIISLYLFFIFDFELNPENNMCENTLIGDEIELNLMEKMCKIATFLSPFSWFFYGLNIPYLVINGRF